VLADNLYSLKILLINNECICIHILTPIKPNQSTYQSVVVCIMHDAELWTLINGEL